jgi:hypothetical protein
MNPDWEGKALVAHVSRLTRSYRLWTGHELFPGVTEPRELARAFSLSRRVVVSHGTEPDPILNYGNPAALELWEMSWEQFTSTPSRFTAEAPNREERSRLLARVTAHGFINDYSGIRISSQGRRFRIEQATVWNVLDEAGRPHGQAATFTHWTF